MTEKVSWPNAKGPLLVAIAVTAVVTAISHYAPDEWANTAVGGVFLGVTWLLVLRRETHHVRAHGMSLGGLTEPVKLDPGRIGRDTLRAVGWCALFMFIFWPPFWYGYTQYWPVGDFALSFPDDLTNRVLGQVLVVALPEEAFFRGYLQSSLDGALPDRTKTVLGAKIGLGWLLSAAIFAVGHLLTVPDNAGRLAVFAPALLFGWLRARTGGIGAGVLFHACCNLLSATLAQSYGLI